MEPSSKNLGLDSLLLTSQRIRQENSHEKEVSTIVESGLGKALRTKRKILKEEIFFDGKKVFFVINNI